MMKSKGLSTEPWWTPTFTLNLLPSTLFIPTLLLLPEYIAITILTNHSITPSFLKDHLTTSLGTLSKAFSGSTKAKYSFFLLPRYLSCNCRAMKIVSMVLLPGMNPNCIESVLTCLLISSFITFLKTFTKCSKTFEPL